MNPLSLALLFVVYSVIFHKYDKDLTMHQNVEIPVYQAALEYEVKSELGEGAFWNYETGKLWWIDIEKRKLHIYDPLKKINREIDVKERIGTVVPDNQGQAIIALQSGIYELNLMTEAMRLLCNPIEGKDSIRFNDGKCDPSGGLWVGSMHLKFIPGAASLYRIVPDGTYEEVFGNVTISNGIIWSNDHRILYYIDTPKRNVRAWDFDMGTGKISNERLVIEIPHGMGSPDGMTIDEEGKLWVAHWGGQMVGRWDPLTGELICKVEVPAPNVTSCAFGGPDLDILYITTAAGGQKGYPLAGSLFKVNTGIKGVKGNFFKNKTP